MPTVTISEKCSRCAGEYVLGLLQHVEQLIPELPEPERSDALLQTAVVARKLFDLGTPNNDNLMGEQLALARDARGLHATTFDQVIGATCTGGEADETDPHFLELLRSKPALTCYLICAEDPVKCGKSLAFVAPTQPHAA